MAPDSRFLTLTAYAKRRGVSKQSVSEAIKAGRLVACLVKDEYGQNKIGDPALADREWDANTDLTKAPTAVKVAAAARAAPGTGDGDASDLTVANTRKAHWDAELKELKFKEAAGELVLASDVKREWADILSQVRTKLLGLPTQVKQAVPTLTVADVVIFENLIREALEDLVRAEQEQ